MWRPILKIYKLLIVRSNSILLSFVNEYLDRINVIVQLAGSHIPMLGNLEFSRSCKHSPKAKSAEKCPRSFT